jgi:hypothetical protein
MRFLSGCAAMILAVSGIAYCGGALAQAYSNNAIVRFSESISSHDYDPSLDFYTLQNINEFSVWIDVSSPRCGITEGYVREIVSEQAKKMPFKVVQQPRHSVIAVFVELESSQGSCRTQVDFNAIYRMNILLPGQVKPWEARIPLWSHGYEDVETDADIVKHREEVAELLQNAFADLADHWLYDNAPEQKKIKR